METGNINISRQWRGMLLTAAALGLLSPLTFHLAAFRLSAFCWPAAWLSAQLLGGPCVAAQGGYLIEQTGLPVLVSLACSGTSFFVLLTAMLLGLLYRCRRLTVTATLSTVAAAYGITLFTNACRITLGFFVAMWARQVLPESLWAGAHLCTGVLVFLSALVGVYVLSDWRLNHDRSTC